jgi:hypothetical protein
MQTILKNVSEMTWKGKVMWIPFFLFAGCAQNDEGMAPQPHQRIGPTPIENESARLNLNMSTDMKRVFTAHLSAANEVPPAVSNGQGQAVFELNEDGTALHYKLNVANTKNITQSHIHCGEAGVNGPVVVFLFGFDAAGVNKNGVLAEGTITSESIIPRDSSATCVGGLNSFEMLLERMRNGGAYVNVHTLAYPGGEIRGQIE